MPEVMPSHEVVLAHFDEVDPVIAALARAAGPCTMGERRRGSCFEALASAIASQQISGLVARRILERLVAAHEGAFPQPHHITAAEAQALRAIGFSFSKIAALKDLAAKVQDGTVPDDDTAALLPDEELIERLVQVRGIGRWSAQMLLMFHLARPDVLPADDFGVRNGFRHAYGLKGLPLPRPLLAYGARWAPYRSIASWYLWRAVDLAAEGRLPARAVPRPRIAQAKAKAKRAPARGKRKGAATARRPR